MCRLTYNAFRNVDTDSSSFMEEELIYCLVNGKRWTASFIKHQHLQGFKFNLNRAGEIRVANTVGSKSIRIGYPQYIKIYINEKTEFNIFKYLLNNISLSLSRTNSS